MIICKQLSITLESDEVTKTTHYVFWQDIKENFGLIIHDSKPTQGEVRH